MQNCIEVDSNTEKMEDYMKCDTWKKRMFWFGVKYRYKKKRIWQSIILHIWSLTPKLINVEEDPTCNLHSLKLTMVWFGKKYTIKVYN